MKMSETYLQEKKTCHKESNGDYLELYFIHI